MRSDVGTGIANQRERVAELETRLRATATGTDSIPKCATSLQSQERCQKNVWIVGGDGWLMTLDTRSRSRLCVGRNVNILVLDTESTPTRGADVEATPRAAVAKFAAGGKRSAKKDLAMMAMSYGTVYIARVALEPATRRPSRHSSKLRPGTVRR